MLFAEEVVDGSDAEGLVDEDDDEDDNNDDDDNNNDDDNNDDEASDDDDDDDNDDDEDPVIKSADCSGIPIATAALLEKLLEDVCFLEETALCELKEFCLSAAKASSI